MVLCPDPWLQNLGAAGSVPHSKPQSVRLIGGGRLLSSIRAVGDAKGATPFRLPTASLNPIGTLGKMPDIPLHFFFGIQLEGALELRSWFWLDVILGGRKTVSAVAAVNRMVVLIDIFVFLLEAVLVSGMDGTVFRSARLEGGTGQKRRRKFQGYLRVLRLLRLFRLIRVFKLTRELTLLANRFLSTHAFMVMKIVAGLSMMIATWIKRKMSGPLKAGGCELPLIEWSDGESWVSVMGLKPEEALRAPVGRPSPPRARFRAAPPPSAAPQQTDELERERDGSETPASFADAYAASMHWALTQFTPATNNIAPISGLERFFAIWIILLAMGVFSSFIGSITTTVSSLRSIRAEHSAKQSKLLQFFIERDLSVDLFSKVQEALRREGAFKVRSSEKEVDLMRGIPATWPMRAYIERFKIQLHEELPGEEGEEGSDRVRGTRARSVGFVDGIPSQLLRTCEEEKGSEEDQFLIRLICHEAMEEAAAPPGQDVFLPGSDCAQAL
ncbi:Serine/threonine-protein kinase pelle, partial [Durusdinium trenchii]